MDDDRIIDSFSVCCVLPPEVKMTLHGDILLNNDSMKRRTHFNLTAEESTNAVWTGCSYLSVWDGKGSLKTEEISNWIRFLLKKFCCYLYLCRVKSILKRKSLSLSIYLSCSLFMLLLKLEKESLHISPENASVITLISPTCFHS